MSRVETATPDSFAWNDGLLVGHGPMDETHREFVDLVKILLACAPGEALAPLREFEAHARRHFAQEDEWMRTTAFPPWECHVDEHAKVLLSVQEVTATVAAGQADADLAHDLAQHLADWLPAHTAYMDSALATWIAKRTHGGAPVVLRRDAAKAENAREDR